MNIYENTQTSININQNRWTPWTNENQWKSKKIEIPKQFIRGRNAARSFRLQARGYEHNVWGLLPGSFRYVGGLSESGDFQL